MRVAVGESVQENQVIASAVSPLTAEQLRCPGRLPERYVSRLIESRERTQRFTGVKLARLLGEPGYRDVITRLAEDREEDVYVRLEGTSYLVSIGARSARDGFGPYFNSSDDQTRLESVIALAETSAPEAIQLLGEILDDRARPYFLRSAAAWSLSKVRNDEATRRLVRAFADVDWGIREEALEGIISIGGPGIPILLDGLEQVDENVAAGCAEALRQQQSGFDAGKIAQLLDQLRHQPSQWAVWLVAHLPQEHVAATIAELEQGAPQLHYAVTLLWAFIRSWIARRWELTPGPSPPETEG
jgi:HEAT repeat protein